ncbi:hypothetical protein H8958_015309 [Nasalis larvatus]
MPKKRQALVEFEDVLGACNTGNYTANNQIYIAGHPAFVNYFTRQKISRPGNSDDSRSVNSVLLSLYHPEPQITTDVLYTICNPCGPVQRIVIFRKKGVQAMVEFACVQSARWAKASLHGAEIYSDCCTLKIEYAKPTRLNVFKNDQDTWDYTNRNLSGKVTLAATPTNARGSPLPWEITPQNMEVPTQGGEGEIHEKQAGGRRGGDGYAVDRATTYLNNNFMFGQKLNVCLQAARPHARSVMRVGSQVLQLQRLQRIPNNRFPTLERAAKNRLQQASNVLQFFNAPPEVAEGNFSEMCDVLGVKRPASGKVFSGESERSCSGLLEW